MSEQQQKRSQIWQCLALVPAGKVVTYGQLATMAGLPGYARFVGTTLKNLPEDSSLPWHRIVNAAGKISFPEQSPKYQEQHQRLLSEGICFINQRIPMASYRWQL